MRTTEHTNAIETNDPDHAINGAWEPKVPSSLVHERNQDDVAKLNALRGEKRMTRDAYQTAT